MAGATVPPKMALQLGIGLNWYDPGYPITDNHPVVCVSWNEAIVLYTMAQSRKLVKLIDYYRSQNGSILPEQEPQPLDSGAISDEGCDYANGADLDITPESFLEEMKGQRQ